MSNGIVDIHGREYKTVARRLADFRADAKYEGWSIGTDVLDAGENILVRATIFDASGSVIATGHAEEQRGSTNINRFSALENAETSAVGRCLAFVDGALAGTEIASADELLEAVAKQTTAEVSDKHIRHMAAVKDNFDSIATIKGALANDEYGIAVEAYYELDEETQRALALAPTKGGVWEVSEYKALKSNEWAAARKSHFGESNE